MALDNDGNISECTVCKEECVQDKSVSCSGPCGKYYHKKCSKLKKSEFDALTINDNLKFFCADCKDTCVTLIDLLRAIQNVQNTVTIQAREISQLKSLLETAKQKTGVKKYADVIGENSRSVSGTGNAQRENGPFVRNTSIVSQQAVIPARSGNSADNQLEPRGRVQQDRSSDEHRDDASARSVNENINNSDSLIGGRDEDFEVYVNKRKARKVHNVIRGRGKGEGAEQSLTAAQSKVWLHVSKLQRGTTAEEVTNYLIKTIPDISPNVEKLETLGSNCAFKVGADYGFKDQLEDGDNWPENVQVRRFFFSKKHEGRK